VIGRLLLLIGLTLAFWVLVAIPVRWAWGDAAAVYSGVAAVLCLIPAAGSLTWAVWAYRQPADKQLTMVMGATGVRLFAVVGGAFAIYQLIPYFRAHETPGFLTCVGVFYIFTLGLETVLSLAARPGASQPLPATGTPSADRHG